MVKCFKIFICVLTLVIFNCEEILEVDDISNKHVTLLAPYNGAIISQDTLSFNWEPLGDSLRYHFQIARPNFMATEQLASDTLMYSNFITRHLEAGDYQWRVKAINDSYETPYTIQTLTIAEQD